MKIKIRLDIKFPSRNGKVKKYAKQLIIILLLIISETHEIYYYHDFTLCSVVTNS